MKGRRRNDKVGLALAGGGPLGAICGDRRAVRRSSETLRRRQAARAVRRLRRRLEFRRLRRGGASPTACAPQPDVRAPPSSLTEGRADDPDPPADLSCTPGVRRVRARGCAMLAPVCWRIQPRSAYVGRPSARRPASEVLERLGARVCPPACSSNSADRGAHAVAVVQSAPGRTDDFRKLPRKLFIVATDLDSGRVAEFGFASGSTTCRFPKR